MALVIRKDQMQAFDRLAEEKLVGQFKEHLRSSRPAAAKLPDRELHRRVRLGMDRAQEHGLESCEALRIFVEGMLDLGPNFSRHRLVQRMLSGKNGTPDIRFVSGMARLTDAERSDIERKRDESAWV